MPAMSFLRRLFGGGSAREAPPPSKSVEHKGFTVRAAPFESDGRFQTAGVIEKEVDPAEFLDTSFQAGIRELSTEYIKEGIEAWKAANPDKIIN